MSHFPLYFPCILQLYYTCYTWTSQIRVHLGHLLSEIVHCVRIDIVSEGSTELSSTSIDWLSQEVINTFVELQSFKISLRMLFEISYFHDIIMFYLQERQKLPKIGCQSTGNVTNIRTLGLSPDILSKDPSHKENKVWDILRRILGYFTMGSITCYFDHLQGQSVGKSRTIILLSVTIYPPTFPPQISRICAWGKFVLKCCWNVLRL